MQNAQVFKFRGEWNELVNKGEAVSQVLQEAEVEEDSVKEWEDWRPREEERFSKELREKTAKTACVNKNTVEKEGKSAIVEAGEAVGDFGRAVEAATKGERDTASEKSKKAAEEFALSVDTIFRKAIRRFELVVYKHIVARTNPHYFDKEEVFASIQKERSLLAATGKKEKKYSLSVEIQDKDMSAQFEEHIQE